MPNPPTPRQDEVLDRTVELVGEVGLAGVTVRRVAERVGFSEAALYRHFDSKQALLLALVDRLATRLLEPIRALARDESRPATARLEAILQHHVRFLIATDGAPILLLAEASISGDPVLVERIREVVGSYLALLEDLVARVAPAAGPSPQELGMLLMGLPASVALRRRLLPETLREERVDALAAFFVTRLTGGAEPRAGENR